MSCLLQVLQDLCLTEKSSERKQKDKTESINQDDTEELRHGSNLRKWIGWVC